MQAGSRRPDLRIYDAVVEALLENAGRIAQLVVRRCCCPGAAAAALAALACCRCGWPAALWAVYPAVCRLAVLSTLLQPPPYCT